MEKWLNRVALVTGASQGIGASLSKRLVKSGLKVVGCARNFEKLKELETELKSEQFTGEFYPIKCDVSQESEVNAMFDDIKAKYGGVDICINNAGIFHCTEMDLINGKPSNWEEMIKIDILGLCMCTKKAIASMKERSIDDGYIIHIGSQFAHQDSPDPSSTIYTMTKHGVMVLTEGLRKELRAEKSKIRITCINPGVVNTPMTASAEEFVAATSRMESKKEWLTPDDVASAMEFVLSTPAHMEVHDIFFRPTASVL